MFLDHTMTHPLALRFVHVEVDFLYMAQLREEKVRSQLHHIPFDYQILVIVRD